MTQNGTPSQQPPGSTYRVSVHGSGHSFSCHGSESVLAAMTRQGIKDLPIGCRGGGCGVCRVQVERGAFRVGKVARIHVSEEDQNNGFALACRLFPESDLTVIPAPPQGGDKTKQ
jgi:ferredoxin